MHLYDCEYCIANKMYEGRACFLNSKEVGNESYTFTLPVFDGKSPFAVDEQKKELDMEGVLQELVLLEWEKPDAPPFELLRTYFMEPEVCVTAMYDEHADYIGLEQAARDYHTLPFDGGLLDQPKVLLNAFRVVAAERNQWERIRMERTDREMKKQKFSNPNPQRPGAGGPRGPRPQLPSGLRRPNRG